MHAMTAVFAALFASTGAFAAGGADGGASIRGVPNEVVIDNNGSGVVVYETIRID